MFCYYFIDPGSSPQHVDVNSYSLHNQDEKPDIASALFLDVNFKAERPSEDLGLADHAYCHSWPHGFWVHRRKTRHVKDVSKDFYSSRVLATRFLLELSSRETTFRGFFKLRGANDPGRYPPNPFRLTLTTISRRLILLIQEIRWR